jgi:hypothetical protein
MNGRTYNATDGKVSNETQVGRRWWDAIPDGDWKSRISYPLRTYGISLSEGEGEDA